MNKKIIFRCDAAKIPELGTGHFYRSIALSKLLKKKYNLKNKDVLFIIKNTQKFKIAHTIAKKNDLNYFAIKNHKIQNYSRQELKVLNKFKSEVIIIDRYDKINKKFIESLRKNYKKIILIDDCSNYRNLSDLSLNPTFTSVKKQKNTYIGFQYNILPSILSSDKTKFDKQINNISKSNKTIFISFGGYDKNNFTEKVIKYLDRLDHSYIYLLNSKFKKTKKYKLRNKIIYYNEMNYFTNLKKADIVLSAGGLTMFDSIFLRKFTICLPQYAHQEKNISILHKKNIVNKIDLNNLKKLDALILSNFKRKFQAGRSKKQKKLLNMKHIKKTLNLIFNIYDRS